MLRQNTILVRNEDNSIFAMRLFLGFFGWVVSYLEQKCLFSTDHLHACTMQVFKTLKSNTFVTS